jgi:hypothetical protein
MSSRKTERMIEEKKHKIDHYENMIREAEIYLQALQDALGMLPRVETDGDSATGMRLQKGSYAQKIYELLKKETGPLHIKQILTKLQISFSNKTRSSVVDSLGPYIRSGRIFTKTAPNTFWLIGLPYDKATASECSTV